MATKSLDRKLAAIHADPHGSDAFILADAKDADMAFGIGAPGQSPEGHPGEVRFRTLEEYREQIRQNTRQGLVDIMLMSASTNYQLTIGERLFDGTETTPAIRANDATDVHLARGAHYAAVPAQPHRSALLDHAMCGHVDCTPGERSIGADLGLYSVTFNNIPEHDFRTLERFHEFREEAERKGFRYFLEVFDPNVPGTIDPEVLPHFLNDMIARMLAGVAGRGRPVFLKIVYHGPKALEELVRYDPHLVVGILGGSSGTTFDAFHLLAEARKYGARVALYGRKINNAENQLAFIQFLRLIADGQIGASEAVHAYHAVLSRLGIRPHRALEDDLQPRATAMSYGGSASVVVPPMPESNGAGNGRPKGPAFAPASASGARVDCGCNDCGCKDSSTTTAIGRPAGDRDRDGTPILPGGLPDFSRMDVGQRLAYHRRRLGLGT